MVFLARPTKRASVAQGLFKVCPGAGQNWPGIPKIASGPLAFL